MTNETTTPARVTRYFHTTNANREFKVGKERLDVRFEPYSFAAGALLGMIRTDDPHQQRLLSKLIAAKDSVEEITEEQFWQNLGAKQTAQKGTFQTSVPPALTPPAPKPFPPLGDSMEKKTGVVVDGSQLPEKPIEITSEPVSDVAAALQVGDVRPNAAAKAKQARVHQRKPEIATLE